MSLALLALVLDAVGADARPSDELSALAIFPAIAAVELAVMLTLWRAFRSRGGEDDPGSGGDGPGGSRRRPPRPPPDGPVCWAEFERQFAEYVATAEARDATSR